MQQMSAEQQLHYSIIEAADSTVHTNRFIRIMMTIAVLFVVFTAIITTMATLELL